MHPFLVSNRIKLFKKTEELPKSPELEEPGSLPLKADHVRLFHATHPDATQSIRENGLSLNHAQGHKYGEPNMIWAVPAYEGYGDPQARPKVEFQVPKAHLLDRSKVYSPWMNNEDDINHALSTGSHFALTHDIPKENVLAIHEPDHYLAREMMKRHMEPGHECTPDDHSYYSKEYPRAYNMAAPYMKNILK